MTQTRQFRHLTEDDPTEIEQPTSGKDDGDDGDFKVTVRKLELPVRPRGVLAE
jgi:hypothetical protein